MLEENANQELPNPLSIQQHVEQPHEIDCPVLLLDEPATLTALLNDIPNNSSSNQYGSDPSKSPSPYANPHHHSHYYPPSLTASFRSITSSEDLNLSSSERSITQPISNLTGNLMRSQKLRDPLKVYEVLEVLGEGSMGRVSRVRKRKDAMSGSARAKSMAQNKGCCFPFLDWLRQWFPGITPQKQSAFVRVESVGNLTSAPMTPRRGHKRTQSAPTVTFHGNNAKANFNGTNMGSGSTWASVVSSSGGRSASNKHKKFNSGSGEQGTGDTNQLIRKKSSLISFTNKRDVMYALKSIHLNRCSTSVYVEELKNEVEILKQLDHPNIVRAIETFDYRNRLYIVLELCSGGDLYTREPYSEQDARTITSSLLSAVNYLHCHGIVHRDLKFENIMFVNSHSNDIKLIDFGLSQKFAHHEHLHDPVGTVYTMAPELLAGDYTSQADVWSCGVISFMLLSSSMPFYGQTRVSVIKKILKGKFKFSARKWSAISLPAREYVAACLTMDPDLRPTASAAQSMPWFRMEFSTSPSASSLAPGTPKIGRQDSNLESPDSMLLASPSQVFEMEQMDRIQTSILSFAGYSQLKKLALLIVAYKSTTDEIGFLRNVFEHFDVGHDGEISAEEFKNVLSTHYNYTEHECLTMFRHIDVDGNGTVHYSEFLAATLEAHGVLDESRLAEAFDRLDCDDDGYITMQNLRDFLGEDVPEKYIRGVIDEVDINGDHRISYDEFIELWLSEDDDVLSQTRQSVASRHLTSSSSVVSSMSDIEINSTESNSIISFGSSGCPTPVVDEGSNRNNQNDFLVESAATTHMAGEEPFPTLLVCDEKKEQVLDSPSDVRELPSPSLPVVRVPRLEISGKENNKEQQQQHQSMRLLRQYDLKLQDAGVNNTKRYNQSMRPQRPQFRNQTDKKMQEAVDAAAFFKSRKALSIRAAVV